MKKGKGKKRWQGSQNGQRTPFPCLFLQAGRNKSAEEGRRKGKGKAEVHAHGGTALIDLKGHAHLEAPCNMMSSDERARRRRRDSMLVTAAAVAADAEEEEERALLVGAVSAWIHTTTTAVAAVAVLLEDLDEDERAPRRRRMIRNYQDADSIDALEQELLNPLTLETMDPRLTTLPGITHEALEKRLEGNRKGFRRTFRMSKGLFLDLYERLLPAVRCDEQRSHVARRNRSIPHIFKWAAALLFFTGAWGARLWWRESCMCGALWERGALVRCAGVHLAQCVN